MIPWGPWNPDDASPNSGKAAVAEGVYPIAAGGFGYAPYAQLVPGEGAAALGAEPRGVRSVLKPNGEWAVYAATEDKIFELQSDLSWDEIDDTRTLPAGEDVSMVVFGNKLINSDTSDGMRAYDLDTPGTNDPITGAPAARSLVVINNVLFGLGTAAEPRRLENSDIGNYAEWEDGNANGITLQDGGDLVGGVDLKNGLGVLFQEYALRLVTFGAGASNYSLTKLSDGLGCVHPRTITSYDGRVAWFAEDGVWEYGAGGAPRPMGAEKVNRWLEANIGRQNFASVQGSVDPVRKLWLWRLNSSSILAWSWLLDEPTILPASTAALARIAEPALTIDDLTGTVDELGGSINALGGSSAPTMGGLNLNGVYATFTGGTMEARLRTCRMNGARNNLFQWATPIDDAVEGTLQIGVSDRTDAALEWKSGASKTRNGAVPFRARGQDSAFQRNIPAGTDWSYAVGVDHVRTAQAGFK